MPTPESVIFKPKTQEQLQVQLQNTSEIIGESLIPPSVARLKTPIPLDSLKERFPERYRIYADSLRRARLGGDPAPASVKKLHALNALDEYARAHYMDESTRTLMDRQMTVFESMRDSLEAGGREGYIKLPTAAGKTVLFIELVEATGLQTLVVMPTRVLVDQTAEKFHQFAPTVEVGKVYTDAKEFGRQVTLTTYDSFMARVDSGSFAPDHYKGGLLILDEAHRALSRRRRHTIELFRDSIRLGFTATPKYATNKELKNLLNHEIHSMSIPEAIELGLLSPLSVYLAETDIDLSKIRVAANGDYDERDLERALNITSRNLAAVEVYKRLFGGQKTVIYCVGVRHAETLAKHFSDHGIAADFVSGLQSRTEQQDRLERFKTGEIKVICNSDILIEGFDERTATVCLNLRPTLSAVVAEQRAGRVLRIDPNNPRKHAIIVDFIGKNLAAGGGVGHNPPITFAQILERAEIFKKAAPFDGRGTGRYTKQYPSIEISGIKVITSTEEVIRVTRELSGITEDRWHSLNALSRRFRVDEKSLLRLIRPIRAHHPDYVQTRLQAGQPKEYFAPTLVETLRVYLDPDELKKEIGENNLQLTEKGLPKLFIGTWKTLRPVVDKVLEEITKNNPNIIVRRRVKGVIIQVCTDKNLFIALMKKEGVILREEKAAEEPGFIVTSINLQKNFIGSSVNSLRIARSVIEDLKREDPESVVYVYRGPMRVPYVKDKQKFVEAMTTKGLIYRPDREKLLKSSFIVSAPNLKAAFKGSDETLLPIAREIVEEMRRENTDLIKKVSQNGRPVSVVTDREKFIKAMQERGIFLKSAESRVREDEFAITQSAIKRNFKGYYTRVKAIAEEVASRLESENPESVTTRYSGSKKVRVVRNKERFIAEMTKRGIKLKN